MAKQDRDFPGLRANVHELSKLYPKDGARLKAIRVAQATHTPYHVLMTMGHRDFLTIWRTLEVDAEIQAMTSTLKHRDED
jgi:hypothetical protein